MNEIQLAIIANALTLIALFGAFVGWAIREQRFSESRREEERKLREQERKDAQFVEEEALRKDEVAVWAKDAVHALQSVVVLCAKWGPKASDEYRQKELCRLAIDLSCLLEQGRLFFKNEDGEWGRGKPSAYQGFRPKILDELLVGFLVAAQWDDFGSDQKFAAKVVENAEKRFLSMVQKEVGRDKTVDDYNRVGGENIDIHRLIEAEKRPKPSS